MALGNVVGAVVVVAAVGAIVVIGTLDVIRVGIDVVCSCCGLFTGAGPMGRLILLILLTLLPPV